MERMTLWTDAGPTPAEARAQLAALPRERHRTDRAAYLRAKMAGARWYCPRACTNARGPDCECPCARTCHQTDEPCRGH